MLPSEAIQPKFQKLYLCRYGFHGASQVCIFLGYRGDGYVVRKWRANSGRWTERLVIDKQDLVAKASREDCHKAAVDVRKL